MPNTTTKTITPVKEIELRYKKFSIPELKAQVQRYTNQIHNLLKQVDEGGEYISDGHPDGDVIWEPYLEANLNAWRKEAVRLHFEKQVLLQIINTKLCSNEN